MAYINEELSFKGGDELYRAYINDKYNLFITEAEPLYKHNERFIVINKD